VRGDAATLAQIAQLITDINFFGLQGNFLSGVPAGEDTYRYRLAVVSGEWERAIQAQEGYMPEEIVRLLGLIRQVGDNAAQS